jgi:type I restriction enzyme, S subunit
MMAETKNTKALYNIEIPGDWSLQRFDEFAKFFSGGTPLTSKPEYYKGNIPFIKSGEIYFDKTEQFISEEALKTSSAKMVNVGDLLYALYGANSGEVAISKIKGAINQAILCIRHDETCETAFIYNYLLSRKESIIRTYLQGGQGNLSAEIVKSLIIPLPPLPEQKAISRVLSTWDEAINKTEQLIAQKELRKKWLLQNLLKGKMRLKGFEDKWISYHISNLFNPIDRYIEWNENELYNLISIRRRNGGVFFREPLFGHQIGVKKLKIVLKNDFLISKRQVSHGAWAIIDQSFNKAKVSDEYNCLELSDQSKLIADFWKWYCQNPMLTHYANVDSDGVHIEKSIFDFNLFKRRKVFIPISIEEQTAIAQVLQAADKEIRLLKAKAEKLREQKKGLMQVLLTGKKRLNQNLPDDRICRIETENISDNHVNSVNSDSDN